MIEDRKWTNGKYENNQVRAKKTSGSSLVYMLFQQSSISYTFSKMKLIAVADYKLKELG